MRLFKNVIIMTSDTDLICSCINSSVGHLSLSIYTQKGGCSPYISDILAHRTRPKTHDRTTLFKVAYQSHHAIPIRI